MEGLEPIRWNKNAFETLRTKINEMNALFHTIPGFSYFLITKHISWALPDRCVRNGRSGCKPVPSFVLHGYTIAMNIAVVK